MTFKAGSAVEDLCRVCKEPREHRVIAVDDRGAILRVICGYCGSQHNFRGGGSRPVQGSSSTPERINRTGAPIATPIALVSDRERRFPRVDAARTLGQSSDPQPTGTQEPDVDLELLLRTIIREEAGLTPVTPADKWRGGDLVLRPGKPGLQEKVVPIETFFNKIVMLRNRLRVLEQQVNGTTELPEEQKLKLQGYITACYGTLTTFNILFADEADKFKGTGGD